jgi:hypothetical protein
MIEDLRKGLPIAVEDQEEVTSANTRRVIDGHRLSFVDGLVEKADPPRAFAPREAAAEPV